MHQICKKPKVPYGIRLIRARQRSTLCRFVMGGFRDSACRGWAVLENTYCTTRAGEREEFRFSLYDLVSQWDWKIVRLRLPQSGAGTGRPFAIGFPHFSAISCRVAAAPAADCARTRGRLTMAPISAAMAANPRRSTAAAMPHWPRPHWRRHMGNGRGTLLLRNLPCRDHGIAMRVPEVSAFFRQ